MSSLAATKPYDPVFDAQKHYRTLLQSTARPGTIGQFDDVLLDISPLLNRATALIALTLLSSESSFFLMGGDEPATEFLRRETLARPVSPDRADFVILPDPARLDVLDHVRTGTLAYPDLGATAVVQVAAVSPAPLPGSLRLSLTGPGIETESVVFVLGAPEALFEKLQQSNAEFPVGIDSYFTCDSLSAGPCVLGLPRTTRVRWERV